MRALAIALLAALVLPSAAFAGPSTNAPPGNSGVEQYFEVIPDATGNRPAQGVTRSGSDSSGGPLPQSVAKKLNALGADGRAVAGLVATTAPKRAGVLGRENSTGTTTTSNSGDGGAIPSGGAPAVGKAAVDTVNGSGGGLGLVLPIAIGAILLAGVAARLFRRSRT